MSNYYEERLREEAVALEVERDVLRNALSLTTRQAIAYQKSYEFLKEARRDIEKAFPGGDFDAEIEACMQAVEDLK